MSVTQDARQLFTERHDTYARFIRAVLYPQGLRSYFLASPLLRPGVRVLDAGCGTGALTLAVYDASLRRGIPLGSLNGFDLTPAMLVQLRATLEQRSIRGIELAEANVLGLDALPAAWRDYDLVVSHPCSNTYRASASSMHCADCVSDYEMVAALSSSSRAGTH